MSKRDNPEKSKHLNPPVNQTQPSRIGTRSSAAAADLHCLDTHGRDILVASGKDASVKQSNITDQRVAVSARPRPLCLQVRQKFPKKTLF